MAKAESKPRGKAGSARVETLKKDILSALKTDLTLKAIAEAYGVSAGVVSRIAKAAGIARGDANPKKARRGQNGYTQETKNAAIADALATSPEKAGQKHDIAPNTIRYWMRAAGKPAAARPAAAKPAASNGNGHASGTVRTNGKHGGDLIAAVNGVLRLLEPLSQAQRVKLLDTARGLVA